MLGRIFGNNDDASPPKPSEDEGKVAGDGFVTVTPPGIPADVNNAKIIPAQVSLAMDRTAHSYDEACEAIALASLVAPIIPEEKEDERLPLEIVAVVDCSGSMHGEKMKLMIKTLQTLVKKSGLTSRDKFSIVSFETNVVLELDLQEMSPSGRAAAIEATKNIYPKGQTNLSGGLLMGCDILTKSSKHNESKKSLKSVLLFTDGLANLGITDTKKLVKATSKMTKCSGASVYTFGFGENHNEDMLQAIATCNKEAGGAYYHISAVDEISPAFADCLGGLVSVVAQNAVLTIKATQKVNIGSKPTPTIAITKVFGDYAYTGDGTSSVAISIGDLCVEDEKDILIKTSVLALPEAQEEPHPVLNASLRYFCVHSCEYVTIDTTLKLSRPVAASPQEIPLKIVEHMNRIEAANAMAEAAALADKGDISGGRNLLLAAEESLKKSRARDSEANIALAKDLADLSIEYSNRQMYMRSGRKKSKMNARCYQQQQSNHVAARGFAKKGKIRMMQCYAEEE